MGVTTTDADDDDGTDEMEFVFESKVRNSTLIPASFDIGGVIGVVVAELVSLVVVFVPLFDDVGRLLGRVMFGDGVPEGGTGRLEAEPDGGRGGEESGTPVTPDAEIAADAAAAAAAAAACCDLDALATDRMTLVEPAEPCLVVDIAVPGREVSSPGVDST